MFDQLGSAAAPPPPKLHGNLVRNSRGNLDVLDTPQGIIFNSTTTAPNEMTRQEDSNGYQLPVHPNPLLPAGRKADGQGRQPVHGSSGLHEHRWLSHLNRDQTSSRAVFRRWHHRLEVGRVLEEAPHGLLVRWVAGASLRGGPGHDGVGVHAASAPGGPSATAATGGATHVAVAQLLADVSKVSRVVSDSAAAIGEAGACGVPVEPKLEHLRRGPVTLGWSNTGNQQVPS